MPLCLRLGTTQGTLFNLMTPRSLTLIFCGSVSLEAMCYALRSGAVFKKRCVVITEPVSSPACRDNTLSILARMRVWLQLIFNALSGRRVSVEPRVLTAEPVLNRRAERRAKHKAVLGRCTYALGHILLRRYGYARFVQWLCNHTLVGRVERCFHLRCFWGVLIRAARCNIAVKKDELCQAPLRPD